MKASCTAKTTASERGAVFRYSCYSDLQVRHERMAEEIATRAPDVSTHGMFIGTPQVFPLGTPLRIRFRVGHNGTPVRVRGEVQANW